jgi:hypothetical protein
MPEPANSLHPLRRRRGFQRLARCLAPAGNSLVGKTITGLRAIFNMDLVSEIIPEAGKLSSFLKGESMVNTFKDNVLF